MSAVPVSSLPLLLLAAVASLGECQNATTGVAYLRVVSASGRLHENYCAYVDRRTVPSLRAEFDSDSLRPLLDLYPDTGCNWTRAAYGSVAIVARGGCTFAEKAAGARANGAAGLLIVSDTRYSTQIVADANYSVAMLSIVSYRSLRQYQPDARAGLYRPTGSGDRQYLFLALYGMAVCSLLIGCVSAAYSRLLRLGGAGADAELTFGKASWPQLVLIVALVLAVPVSMLLLLNFAYDYAVWALLLLYGYYAASSLVFCVSRAYALVARRRQRRQPEAAQTGWALRPVKLRLCSRCGELSLTRLELAAYPFALAVAGLWFAFRNSHWAFMLTNAFNVLLVARVVEALVQMLRVRVVTILLLAFLVYDVFFVFVTPLLTGDSAPAPPEPTTVAPTLSRAKRDTVMDFYVDRGGSFMERVALGTAGLSGEIIPIVFKVMPYPPPESVTTCLLPYSILGLGDVILPSALLSLNLYLDLAWQRRCWPYFVSSVLGYLLGLGACAGVLLATGSGQPALLYIVPCILAASYLCAALRRELKMYFRTSLPEGFLCEQQQQRLEEEEEEQAEAAGAAAQTADSAATECPSGPKQLPS